MYFFEFARNIIFKLIHILFNRRREARWAKQYLNNLLEKLNGPLTDGAYRKIIVSYSIYLPMIIDSFADLRGRKISQNERERILLYFICSTTFDDFLDERTLSSEALYAISWAPETFQPASIEERAFLYGHLALKQQVRLQQEYQTVTQKLFRAQIDSLQQLHSTLSDAELERITLEKGGYAVLLCPFYLDGESSVAEKNCWYQIGGIIQLTNDLFDIWKDLQAGVSTLPVRIKDAAAFQAFFLGLVTQLETEIARLPFSLSRKRRFLTNMLAICSFGERAITQLKKNQQQDLHRLPRKTLIVDMERPENILHCLRFAYRRCLQWKRRYGTRG
ncbi:MAG: class 1 isoprenoid biosynthesis enzyme [Niabella sp.]|nr:class 1 isoprenoid biosynthesis enzyme [Niabella sp.]